MLLWDEPNEDFIIENNILYKTVNSTDLLVVPETMQADIIKAAYEQGY